MEEPAMNERDLVANTPESAARPLGEPKEAFGDISVITKNTGARMVWSPDHTELRVNSALFPTPDQARIATLRQVGSHIGLTQAIRTDSVFY